MAKRHSWSHKGLHTSRPNTWRERLHIKYLGFPSAEHWRPRMEMVMAQDPALKEVEEGTTKSGEKTLEVWG